MGVAPAAKTATNEIVAATKPRAFTRAGAGSVECVVVMCFLV